jgi:uncharacterized membrane protein YbaN (DUF454 family)
VTAEHRPTPVHRRRTRNTILGFVFFALGVVGLIVPVMPQVVFFLLSAIFFSLVSPRLRRAMRRFRKRHPKLDAAYSKWRESARRRRQRRIRHRRAYAREHGPRGYAGGRRR